MGSECSKRDVKILKMENNLENGRKDGTGGNFSFLDSCEWSARFVLLIVKVN